MNRSRRGQSTAEYAIVIAVVLGAIVGMQTYVKRAINARIADATDTRMPDKAHLPGTAVAGVGGDVPAAFAPFTRQQFEPYYAESNSLTTSTIRTSSATNPKALHVAGAEGTASAVTGTVTSTTSREGSSSESVPILR